MWRSVPPLIVLLLVLRLKTLTSLSTSSNIPSDRQQLPRQMNLPEVYRSIANKALDVDRWPDSTNFLQCLHKNEKGEYVVPTFPKGEGPVGLMALASRQNSLHPGNSMHVNACLDMFDSFCEDLRQQVFTKDDGELMEEYFVIVKSLAPHLTVAIFQEHPELLMMNARQENDFYFMDNENMRELAKSLVTRASNYEPIDLMLDSVLLTSDGAMIAGYVDNSKGSFGSLKGELLDDAMDILQGNITSRPKRLIHMTCGRVVSINDFDDGERQMALKTLVERYNQHLLPNLVAQLNDPVFRLDEITLLRNDVWLCEQNTEYGVGKLSRRSES